MPFTRRRTAVNYTQAHLSKREVLTMQVVYSTIGVALVSHNGYCRIDHLSIPIQDPPKALKLIHLVG
jgi:hypothetical protein